MPNRNGTGPNGNNPSPRCPRPASGRPRRRSTPNFPGRSGRRSGRRR